MDLFEQLEEVGQSSRPKRPIWTLDLDDAQNEKKILDWLNGELSYLIQKSRERLSLIERNEHLYRGIQYETQEIRRDLQDRSVDKSRSLPKVVVNHLYDLTANRVSRLVKYRPAVAIMPNSNEHQDKISAKTTKSLLDNIWYQENFDSKITPEVAVTAAVKGEAYLWIDWNPNKGDLHPDSPKEGNPVVLKGENGEPLKGEDGKELTVDRPVRVGDVEYEVIHPEHVFLQPQDKLDKVEYCFRMICMSVDDAKVKYPKAADKIKANVDKYKSYQWLKSLDIIEPVVIWEFYHKRTESLDKGRTVVFTDSAVLDSSKGKFNHGELPFERVTDIDEPGKLHGISFFETVKALTSTYNNLTNMIVRNNYLVSHPKWMLPAGSAKIEALANDITIVQYKGPTPPQLAVASPTPPEVYNFMKQVKEEFQQISGVFGVSRGEPPPGIKAGVALQFLNEQESERHNLSVLKWNDFIKRVAKKTLAVCGDYYDISDQRMVRVVGKNNSWQLKFFDKANLNKPYDIKVQNSSALPDSKAARMQTVMDLNKEFPGMLPQEQVVELLDLGKSDEFVDQVTSAVRTAEAENESLLSGEEAKLPEEYENHLLHWQIHARAVQDYAFKNETPEEIQERMIDHIRTTEYFLIERAKLSESLMAKLQALDTFPMFFKHVQPEPLPETPMEGQPLGPTDGASLQEGPIQAPPEVPVNPEIAGSEPQDLMAPPMPEVQEQTEPQSIQPTGSV